MKAMSYKEHRLHLCNHKKSAMIFTNHSTLNVKVSPIS